MADHFARLSALRKQMGHGHRAPAPASAARSPNAPPPKARTSSCITTIPKPAPMKRPTAVRALGREAIVVQADIKSWDQIKAMIETAWSKPAASMC
jgi:hypothetical protein